VSFLLIKMLYVLKTFASLLSGHAPYMVIQQGCIFFNVYVKFPRCA